MKSSTPAMFLLSFCTLLAGCMPDMIAPDRPRGTGTQRLINGTADEVREGFHHYFEKANESRSNSIPAYTITDGTDMVEAVNHNSVMGTAIILRYKIFMSQGPAEGQTAVEVISEMPSAAGMNQPDNLAKLEKGVLDSISEHVELMQARKNSAGSSSAGKPAAAPSSGQGTSGETPWWKQGGDAH
jgi:hypothetical protein